MLSRFANEMISTWRLRHAHILALLAVSILAYGIAPLVHWSLDLKSVRADELTWTMPSLRSLAVMPFTNVSGDSKNDFFAVGVAEDLASNLTQIRRLNVTSYNISSHYDGGSFDSKTIATSLGVRYLVTGDVSWMEELVRLNVGLVLGKTGQKVWTAQYNGRLENISKLELAVVDGIVTYLTSPITKQEHLKLDARSRTSEPGAYLAVLRGKALIRESDGDSLKRAHRLFEMATQLDPDYVKAHELLGYAQFLSGRFEDCLTTANRRVAHSPKFDALHVVRAKCHSGLGRVDEAKLAGAEILRTNPHFTISQYTRSLPYGERTELDMVFKALRLAGLPE